MLIDDIFNNYILFLLLFCSKKKQKNSLYNRKTDRYLFYDYIKTVKNDKVYPLLTLCVLSERELKFKISFLTQDFRPYFLQKKTELRFVIL